MKVVNKRMSPKKNAHEIQPATKNGYIIRNPKEYMRDCIEDTMK